MRLKISCIINIVVLLSMCTLLGAQDRFIKDYRSLEFGVKTLPYNAIKTSDGGYAIVGVTANTNINWDSFIARFDSIGNCIWARRIDINPWDICWQIVETRDQGYAIGGYTGQILGPVDFLFLKFNNAGALEVAKTIGGAGNDVAFSLIRTTPDGYVMAGHTNSFNGSYVLMFVRFDSTYNYQFTKTIDLPSSSGEYFRTITMNSIHQYLTWAHVNDQHALFMRLDGLMNPLTRKIIYSLADRKLYPVATIPTGDGLNGNLTLCDLLLGNNAYEDIVLIKMNNQGQLEWTRRFGGTINNTPLQFLGYGLLQTTALDYVGVVEMDKPEVPMFVTTGIFRWSPEGNLVWMHTAGRDKLYARCKSIIPTADNGYFYPGTFLIKDTVSGDTNLISLIKFDSLGYTCFPDTFAISVNDSMLNLSSEDVSLTEAIVNPTVSDVSPLVVNCNVSDSLVCEEWLAIQEFPGGLIGEPPKLLNTALFFDDQIRIEFSVPSLNPLEVKIYDALGCQIYANSIRLTPKHLLIAGDRIARLSAGIYFLVVSSHGKNLGSVKLVKLRNK